MPPGLRGAPAGWGLELSWVERTVRFKTPESSLGLRFQFHCFHDHGGPNRTPLLGHTNLHQGPETHSFLTLGWPEYKGVRVWRGGMCEQGLQLK